VLIYAVGLLSEEERREAKRAERALNDLAQATGGESFFPKEAAEVERIAHTVARDIRSQYTIQYTPTNQAMDGSFRAIKVAVKAPGSPTARTRNGYYATENIEPFVRMIAGRSSASGSRPGAGGPRRPRPDHRTRQAA